MNKIISALFFIVCLLFSSAIFVASDFDVSVVPIRDSILLKDEASFKVTITNLASSSDIFEISTSDSEWIMRREPFFTSLEAGEKKEFIMYFTPASGTVSGPKGVEVMFKSQLNPETIKKPFYIYLGTTELLRLDYSPSVKAMLKINEDNQIDPRETIVVRVDLKNRNPLNFEKLDIVLSSKTVNVMKSISLGPFEETTEYFEFRINPNLVPQRDTLYLELKRNNKTFEDLITEYEILAYSPFFKKDMTVKDNFFKTETAVIFFNIGNIETEEEFKVAVNWLSRFFYTTSPKAQLRKDNGILYYVWKVRIEPQESYRVDYVRNYRSLFYMIIVGLVSIVLYFTFRSPIVLRKEVFKVQKREGGLYELKVILYLKNRSRKVVNNVQVSDRISHLSEVIRDSYLGSLKPDKIVREENKGTYIKWIIPNVESFEERIITYKIRSKFSILGRLSLPPSRVKFITKSGSVRLTKSNTVSVEA